MSAVLDRWVVTPQFLSAWLQAAAALIALVISVIAIVRSDAVVRRRDRLEIKSLVVAIYPEIQMLRESVDTARANIAGLKAEFGQLVGQSIAATVQYKTYLPIPAMMDRYTDKLFILGDVAGPTCIHLVRLLMQYNDFAAQVASSIISMNAQQWLVAIDQLDEHLVLLLHVIEKGEREVQPLHATISG
ncbi:hypothetical protein [Rhizobium sp. B21/90]|uniref:hypothetical protein n=1 Tax=Rhizobium sp. B21/90 TaxID=2819993 RepID=UPI001C5B1F62|nr:hypothetical protein [Rhizobium sp. B21/90]QYA05014.1 hypothetical protein J5278_27520 [Rhizobium sp. B21/90]